MIDKTTNTALRYIAPLTKVIRISTRTQILNTSLDGNPSVNDYRGGSDSYYGFGDDDE